MNVIKGIEDELMQNEKVEKERRKMKRYNDEKKLRKIISLIDYNI